MITNDKKLPFWKGGDVISHQRLNDIVGTLNSHARSVNKPIEIIPDGEDQADTPVDDSESVQTIYTETARSETTITVTDSAGNTHSINQIDSVTFEDQSGNVMVLQFNND